MQADSAYWQKTLKDLQIATPHALAYWPDIEEAHTAKNRHYHTLDHLAVMFEILDLLSPPELPIVCLAVWFHDLVYDVICDDNEAKSAMAAASFATAQGLHTDQICHLDALIQSTAKHEPLWDHPACHAMLDADLAVLATLSESYDAYAENIRREYASFPDAIYIPGRISVLQRFLCRDVLYFSEPIRNEWSEKARVNLTRELERLEKF